MIVTILQIFFILAKIYVFVFPLNLQRENRKLLHNKHKKVSNNNPTSDIWQSGSLLSGSNSHGLSETTGGLGVLTTDLEVPVVAETTVGTRRHNDSPMQNLPHLLQAVEILTKRGLEVVRDDLLVLSGLHILLSVEEPLGNGVLQRVGNDSNESFNLLVGQLSGTIK